MRTAAEALETAAALAAATEAATAPEVTATTTTAPALAAAAIRRAVTKRPAELPTDVYDAIPCPRDDADDHDERNVRQRKLISKMCCETFMQRTKHACVVFSAT